MQVKLDHTMNELSKMTSQFEGMIGGKNSQIKKLNSQLRGCMKETNNLWDKYLHREGLLDENAILEEKVRYLSAKDAQFHKEMSKLKAVLATKTRKLRHKEQKLQEVGSSWKGKMDSYKGEVKDLKLEIDQLCNSSECMEGDTLQTFKGGKYTDAMRQCCMELVTEGHVSLRKVPVVVKAVMQNLTGKLPQWIPSAALSAELKDQRKRERVPVGDRRLQYQVVLLSMY